MKLKKIYLQIKEELDVESAKKTASCWLKGVYKAFKPYLDNTAVVTNSDEENEMFNYLYDSKRELEDFIKTGKFLMDREESENWMKKFTEGLNFSNRHTYERGEDVTSNFPGLDKEGIHVYRAKGDKVLFRGVSTDDWKRIKSQGYIDSDMRGAISKYEGINLGQNPDTAEYYLPTNKEGVIIAIDPKGLDLYTLSDEYIRVFKPIPIKNVVKVSDPLVKDSMGSVVSTEITSKMEKIKNNLKKVGVETNC